MRGMIKEFREFAVRGNVIDMAVGIIIGAGIATVARSIVDDLIMPPLGLVLGNVDFADLFIVLREGAAPPPYPTLAAAREAGAVTVNYGAFVNAVLSFVIVAFAAFILVRSINRLRRREKDPDSPPVDPANRTCPYCVLEIPAAATRCAHCTSDLEPLVATETKG
jgi:large conductance mechanosensitive channel